MSLEAYLQALGMGALHRKEITVGGRPAVVWARELSGDEVEAISDSFRDESGVVPKARNKDMRNAIVAASICDEHGHQQLDPGEVGALPSMLLAALVTFALDVNGMSETKEADEKKGEPGG